MKDEKRQGKILLKEEQNERQIRRIKGNEIKFLEKKDHQKRKIKGRKRKKEKDKNSNLSRKERKTNSKWEREICESENWSIKTNKEISPKEKEKRN